MKRPTFNGDNAALAASINSLLELDKNNALVPHGLGGLARQLLEASAERLVKEHQEVRFVCTSFPSGEPDSCAFVECENSVGQSINAGEWRKREDGLVELVVRFQEA